MKIKGFYGFIKTSFILSTFCLALASCESNEGKIVNGNGTVSTNIELFKQQTTTIAKRVHHYTQNLDLLTYSEVKELCEDRVVEKGATLEDLASTFLEGFTPQGLTMTKDSDGVPSADIYYSRNTVTVTFNLLKGQNSKGDNKSTISGLYESPLDFSKVDLGNSYFLSKGYVPQYFPATDTSYDLDVATIPNYVMEKEIDGGSFVRNVMGTDFEVTVRNFRLAALEFPQYLWVQIFNNNPSHFQGDLRVTVDGERQDFRPVENLSWFDCVYICNKLSILDGLTPAYSIDGVTDPEKWGQIPEDSDSDTLAKYNSIQWNKNADGYRLPTEAEWEFAALGGNGSDHQSIYAGIDNLDTVAWNVNNSSICTHEIAKLSPNSLGLFDMNGNIDEWCWDIYGDFNPQDEIDPDGAETGNFRVKKGGAYYSTNSASTIVSRNQNLPYRRTSGFGLRLARNAKLDAIGINSIN